MDNTQILIAALKQDRLMNSLNGSLHGFQVQTFEPAFEGELIRALDSGLYSPAVLIISKSICDTCLDAMIGRIQNVSEAVLILAVGPGARVDEEIKNELFSVLELPQEAGRIKLIMKSAVQAFQTLRPENTVSISGENFSNE